MPLIRSLDGPYAVTLTSDEFGVAQRAGQARYQDSRTRCLVGRGIEPSVEADVDGCAAELAVALLLGQTDFIPSVGSFHDADLVLPGGRGLQIRSTSRPDGGLIWKYCDSLNEYYILAVGQGREWRIVGAARGSSIKERGFTPPTGREPVRIMPQHALLNLDGVPFLQELIAAQFHV